MAINREPGGRRGMIPANPSGHWHVALPAWGERCVGVATKYTLPALVVALAHLGKQATIYIWTDQPDRFIVGSNDPKFLDVKFLPVPGPDGAFESMSNCHREILALAPRGDRVLLLTADMVLSREVITTCEQHLAGTRQLICCVAPRALESENPPAGASGRELLSWAWANRHPMTRDCTWPDGESYDVWRMYFEKDGEVAARVFLPHPLACIPNRRPMVFRPTIDVNLTANFASSVTYMITNPDEGSAVEVSPEDKDYVKTTTMAERLADGGPSCPAIVPATNNRHRMFFSKKVVLCGVGEDCGDGPIVQRVLGD